ncbi:UNVERIFIED_CONTAM: hypothetical protein Sindi_1254700, partial [Sesamum indicum]
VRDASNSRPFPPLAFGGSSSKRPLDTSSDSFMAWGNVPLLMGPITVRAFFLLGCCGCSTTKEKLRPVISDYDVSKFSALSDDGFVSMLCGESAR